MAILNKRLDLEKWGRSNMSNVRNHQNDHNNVQVNHLIAFGNGTGLSVISGIAILWTAGVRTVEPSWVTFWTVAIKTSQLWICIDSKGYARCCHYQPIIPIGSISWRHIFIIAINYWIPIGIAAINGWFIYLLAIGISIKQPLTINYLNDHFYGL